MCYRNDIRRYFRRYWGGAFLSYFKPYIDETGIHIPRYTDIVEDLVEHAKSIFGADMYLENDSQDYEIISAQASKIYDAMELLQSVYESRSPKTAMGSALDSVVKINGMKRKVKTKSSCDVLITGVPKTQILYGIAEDIQGVKWDLPDIVVIPESGAIKVTAFCQEFDHTAKAKEICKIGTPTAGWESVINEQDAVKGQSFETDGNLRARQNISTCKPSKTVLEGTIGGIAEISGVLRQRVYENFDSVPDENGIPGHSIAVVVEGGDNQEIAEEIYLRKTPGTGTYGAEKIIVTTLDFYGKPEETVISFFRPVYKDIFVTITIKALYGYTVELEQKIKQNVEEYLNGLRIGDNLSVSAIWGVSLYAMQDLKIPSFSIVEVKAGTENENQKAQDIEILFQEVTRGRKENIEIIVL